jgi:hypothetical protein
LYNYRYGQQTQTTTNIQTNHDHDYQLALALSNSFTPPRTPQIETLTIQPPPLPLNQYTHLSIPSTPLDLVHNEIDLNIIVQFVYIIGVLMGYIVHHVVIIIFVYRVYMHI